MTSSVRFDDHNAKRAINAMVRYLGDSRILMDNVGKELVEYVRGTIRLGGRSRPYAPLAKSTIDRTGRTRPLITLLDQFSYRSHLRSVEIIFTTPRGEKWDIWQHHRGFTTPARVGRPTMVMPQITGASMFFKFARKSTIPARQVWPTKTEAAAVINAACVRWLREGVRDKWR